MREWILIGYPCPNCNSGSIFAVRNKKDNSLWAFCEECDTLWRNPEDILDEEKELSEFEWGGYATLEEVQAFGWEEYIIQK